jgi:DNA-binding NtrC family response regulator
VQAMKNGAYDYVTKPFSVDELKLLLERVASHLKLKSENRMLREKVKSKQGFGGIVGRAPEMEKLYRIIAKAANSVHPVLILGRAERGKRWSHGRFTTQGLFGTSHLSQSIVVRWCRL